jgi:hypothetical protein
MAPFSLGLDRIDVQGKPPGKGLKEPLRKEANSEGLRVGLGLTIQKGGF